MARPTDADSAKTLETIQGAAMDILQTDGPEGLSFRKVAKAAGVGLGTVRYYFATQEELLEACLDGFQDRLVDLERQWVAVLADADDIDEALRQAMRATCLLVWANQPLLRLRMMDSVQKGGLNPRRRRNQRDPFFRNVAGVLAEHAGRSADDLRLVIDTVMRLVSWYGAIDDDEACNVADLADVGAARERLMEHCVQTALQLLRAR